LDAFESLPVTAALGYNMPMNRALEDRIVEAATLPEVEQARLAAVMGDYIEGAKDAAQFERDMEDSDYRAYVEEGVAKGVADLEAGRFAPAREALPRIIAKFKGEHGL